MPVPIFVSLIPLFFLTGTAVAADVSRAEVAADCRAEGKAMGVVDDDLDDYVKECIEEFAGSTMVNHQPRSTEK